jgi:hypothetical protein
MPGVVRVFKSFAMINFRRIPPPRNYLARREQWRLLLLLASLGLVLFLMDKVREPRNWNWFFSIGAGGSGQPSAPVPTEDTPVEDLIQHEPPKGAVPGAPISAAPKKGEGEIADGYSEGVKPAYLDAVRDDTTFRPQERDAWFRLLAILQGTDEGRLRRESAEGVTYGQLFRQSEQYRGQLVTICGAIRRTSLQQAPANDSHIDQYYQTVLEPADNRSELMFVYCLYLPEGFPKGEKVSAEVAVTGFYFKRWVYAAQDGLRTAPVLLARTVDWERTPPAVKKSPAGVGGVLVMIAGALCVSLALTLWVHGRTRRARRREPAAPPQFDALREVATASGPRLPWETADRQGPEARPPAVSR